LVDNCEFICPVESFFKAEAVLSEAGDARHALDPAGFG
jgi:hypothetical protein